MWLLRHSKSILWDCLNNLETEKWRRVATTLKLTIVFVQIVSQLHEVYDIPYPASFVRFANAIAFANLDALALFRFDCAMSVNFLGQLVTATVAPLILGAAMLLVGVQVGEGERGAAWCTYLSFLVFPGVSTTVLRAFTCRPFSDGFGSYLKADLSIDCSSSTYNHVYGLAVFMTIVYPVGIPCVYMWLLRRYRHQQRQERRQQQERAEHSSVNQNTTRMRARSSGAAEDRIVTCLVDSYTDECWWFEIFECVRRLLLLGAGTVLVVDGTTTEISVGVIVAVLSICVYMHTLPYKLDRDYKLAVFAQLSIFFTLLEGLVLKAGVAEKDGYSTEALGVVLILINCLVIAFALVQMWEASTGARTTWKEEPSRLALKQKIDELTTKLSRADRTARLRIQL
jgi:hypothetical protein